MAPALPHGQLDPCSWRGCVTSDAVAVSVVDLFDGAVAEGQFAHPVDSAADAGGQAQTGVGGRCVEAVRPEIVIAENPIIIKNQFQRNSQFLYFFISLFLYLRKKKKWVRIIIINDND